MKRIGNSCVVEVGRSKSGLFISTTNRPRADRQPEV